MIGHREATLAASKVHISPRCHNGQLQRTLSSLAVKRKLDLFPEATSLFVANIHMARRIDASESKFREKGVFCDKVFVATALRQLTLHTALGSHWRNVRRASTVKYSSVVYG